MNIKEELKTKDYDFLKNDTHLGDNIILLTTGGSHAYGTNIKTSDLDIRGIAIESEKEIFGLSNFEQFIDNKTDTTIYGLKKVINLLLNCNPNVIEMFGTKEEHLFMISEEGKLLRDNIDLFLSKKAKYSFGGYATAQLRRLQNSLVKDNYPKDIKEGHILNSIKHQMKHLQKHYSEFNSDDIKVYIDNDEIKIDIDLKNYPLRDFQNIYSEMNNIIKNYEKINSRNKKKTNEGLNKHAMHLVRLLIMGREILEGNGIQTYRTIDRLALLYIRDGIYQEKDGSFKPEFFKLVDTLEEELQIAYNNSKLPSKPDFNKIEDLVMTIYKNKLKRDV